MKTLERRVEEMNREEQPNRNGGGEPTDTHEVEEAPSNRAAPVGAACTTKSQLGKPSDQSKTQLTGEMQSQVAYWCVPGGVVSPALDLAQAAGWRHG